MPTVAGVVTSATYYSGVRVPLSSLVGEENQGWPLITNQLNHERVALTSAAPVMAALADVRDWAASARQADGRRVIDAEWVQLNLARVHAKAEFLKLLNWRVASAGGVLGPADASATKVFGTEFAVEAYRLLMEVLGARGVRALGVARRGAGRADRAGAPGGADPDLRRRDQRGAAGHHRGGRARAAARRGARGLVMDFTVSEAQEELAGLARKILAGRGSGGSSRAERGIAVGRPGRGRACWRLACLSRWMAPGWGCWSSARC